MSLADTAVWVAVIGVVGDAAMAVTVTLTIHFLRPAPPGDVIAEARLHKVGRRLATGDVLMYADGQPEPVAHATVTYALPPPPDRAVAPGRYPRSVDELVRLARTTTRRSPGVGAVAYTHADARALVGRAPGGERTARPSSTRSSRPAPPARSAPASGSDPRPPTRTGSASSETSTG